MSASHEGDALTIGGQQRVPLTFPDPKSEQRIRAQLTTGRALSIRISPAERSDVEGHALESQSVWLNLQLEGDDTEGHAINVHFPTAADADAFRRGTGAGDDAGQRAVPGDHRRAGHLSDGAQVRCHRHGGCMTDRPSTPKI